METFAANSAIPGIFEWAFFYIKYISGDIDALFWRKLAWLGLRETEAYSKIDHTNHDNLIDLVHTGTTIACN